MTQNRTTSTTLTRPDHSDLISARNLLFVFFVARSCTIMIFMPAITTGRAAEDSWAAALLSLLWSIPLSLVLVWAATATPDGLLALAGRRWGKISLLVFAPYLLALSTIPGLFSAELGTLFTTVTMTETPAGMLVLITLVVALYAAYQGIDTIGRVGQVIVTLIIAFSLVTILGVAYEADTGRLQPVFSRGPLPVLASSIHPAAWTVLTAAVLPVMGAKVSPDKAALRKVAVLGNVLSIGLLTVIVVVTTMVFTAQEAQTMHSPAYMLAKMIRIPLTFERLEVIILTAWIGAITLTVGVYLYAAARAIADVLGVRSHRPFLLPLALFAAVLAATVFSSTSRLRGYVVIGAPVAAALAIVLPTAAAAVLRSKQAGEQDV